MLFRSGFSGINVLWEQMRGFPRETVWVFPASIYFYLCSQLNHRFRFMAKDFWHLLPFFGYFIPNFLIFLCGSAIVQTYQASDVSFYAEKIRVLVTWAGYIYYFRRCLKIYADYRQWLWGNHANLEIIQFRWIRNLIYFVAVGEVFKWLWFAIDVAFDLPFEQDWWWNLLSGVVIVYVAIEGYSQPQPRGLDFTEELLPTLPAQKTNMTAPPPKNKQLLIRQHLSSN